MTPINHLLDLMDRLLVDAHERGRDPQHWMIRQADWAQIGQRFQDGLFDDPETVGANTYKGVPIHFATFDGDEIVGLVDKNGEAHFLG